MGRIAVTGTSSFLGSRILRRLADQRDPDSVLAVDIASPRRPSPSAPSMVDLTLPGQISAWWTS
jgi:nucleoside-diphosphate-sugar epimerase